MLISNQEAAAIFSKYGATGCTDITGFGLLAHLGEMITASGVSVQLNLPNIPILAGARDTIKQGIISSLHPQNLQAEKYVKTSLILKDLPEYLLLFDPQTSGGLLAGVPPEKASECVQDLYNLGYENSCIIGSVIEQTPTPQVIIDSYI
jgi:selenide,water dikinase